MKTFTLFNIIVQPILVLLLLLFPLDNYPLLFSLAFILFCGLQISHFLLKIKPQNRMYESLTTSEEIMLGYIILLFLLLLLSIFSESAIGILLIVLITTSAFSAISNYITTIKYYHFINKFVDENF
jgi:hypothetical protein